MSYLVGGEKEKSKERRETKWRRIKRREDTPVRGDGG